MSNDASNLSHPENRKVYRLRQARNEVIFQNMNKKLEAMAVQLLQTHTNEKDFPLQLVCECSDVNCFKKISITLNEYEPIRLAGGFVIMPGHEMLEIENVVSKQKNYYIVQKDINRILNQRSL